jgi:ClpX C4-type zinc finger
VTEYVSAISCSFCGRTGGQGSPAGQLVAGKKGAAICRDCLEVVTQVMDQGDAAAVRKDPDWDS